MSLTLIKEDGTGNPAANCYADVADGDSYHEGRLYAADWTAATTPDKQKSLVMATRLIDAEFQFHGYKRLSTQALQWPRRECRDPDGDAGPTLGLLLARAAYLDETKVPAVVVRATAELARELLKQDRTDDPDGEGVKSLRLDGALQIQFDAKDRPPLVTRLVQTMLGKYGAYLGFHPGVAKLIRT